MWKLVMLVVWTLDSPVIPVETQVLAPSLKECEANGDAFAAQSSRRNRRPGEHMSFVCVRVK